MVLGGLVVSTLFTLFIVPTTFSLMMELTSFIVGMCGGDIAPYVGGQRVLSFEQEEDAGTTGQEREPELVAERSAG